MEYRVCCCSLAGTKACENCNNNTASSEFNFNLSGTITKESLKLAEISYTPVLQYWCPVCSAVLDKWQRYCHVCGSKMKWKDVENAE